MRGCVTFFWRQPFFTLSSRLEMANGHLPGFSESITTDPIPMSLINMSNFWTRLILCAQFFSPCHCKNPTKTIKTGTDKKRKMIFQLEIQIRSFKTLWYYHLQSVLLPNSLKPQFAALRKYSDRKMKSSASNWNVVIGRRLNVLLQQLIFVQLSNVWITFAILTDGMLWMARILRHRSVLRNWPRKKVQHCA